MLSTSSRLPKFLNSQQIIGSRKPTNCTLPADDFTYGKKNIPDKEGASIVTRSWQFHHNSKTQDPLQDFMKINKIAIKKTIYTITKQQKISGRTPIMLNKLFLKEKKRSLYTFHQKILYMV